MKKVLINSLVICAAFISCKAQSNQQTAANKQQVVGGGCDGCELMYVGMPKNLSAVDTNAAWNEKGQKLIISGTVYQLDGKTPAPDVIMYYWQTDAAGYYAQNDQLDARAKSHGHIRGWVKTDANGRYRIQTIRPAPYPNDVLPAHIHLSIKEQDVQNEYYPDDINFEDDPLLLPYLKKYPQEKRGGNGIVKVIQKDSLQFAEHNIILGLNIPHYSKQ